MHDYLKNLIRISDSMTVVGLRYIDYRTGHYGSGKYPGVYLQFICDQSGDDYYVIFNACLIRKRSVGKYKKGTPLLSMDNVGRYNLTDTDTLESVLEALFSGK